MPHVDFEDEDVDALLDMCWTENPDYVSESPYATGQDDSTDLHNNSSTLPDESYIYIREVGCDTSSTVSTPALKEKLSITPAVNDIVRPQEDVLDGMVPVTVTTHPATKPSQSFPAPDLNLLDLPLDIEVTDSTACAGTGVEHHEIDIKPPKLQEDSSSFAQKPVCSDNFCENHQPVPHMASSQLKEFTRAPRIIPTQDTRSITTLATTCPSSDQLESLEEAIIEETQRIREIERLLESRKSRREQLRRDYAMALVRSTPYQPTPVSFTVVVTRCQDRPSIGLVVAYDDDQGYLVVTSVKSEGLVPDENVKRLIRNLPIVETGDHLISINGVSGDRYLMTRELVEGPQTIQLVFVKKSYS